MTVSSQSGALQTESGRQRPLSSNQGGGVFAAAGVAGADALRRHERNTMPFRPHPLVHLLPSLTDVAFLLPVGFLFFVMQGANTLLGDGDTGWHVRTGEWILRNGRVPHADIFSYTMPGRPWVAWEWLWDVAFGWLHQNWGMSSIVVASMAVLGVTFALLFRLILRRCDNPFLALGVTALAAAGSSIHYLARPHLFTLLFVVLFYGILEAASAGRTKWLWALPALMAIWTNVHGGFLIGLLLLATYTAGNLAAWLWDGASERRSAARQQAKWFAGTGLACLAATFLNPYSYHLHAHIYQYLRDPRLYQTVQEYQPLTFQGPLSLFTEPMFVLAVLAAAWALYQRRFVDALLLAGWAQMALMAARNLPIFMLVAAPIVAQLAQEMLGACKRSASAGWIGRALSRFEETSREFAPLDRIPRVHLASIAVMAVLTLAIATPRASGKFRAEYDPTRYPAKALPVLRSDDTRRIFTHDEWGDYLIYNLYPLRKVFVDGRSDFYGPAFNEKYLDVMGVKPGWEQNLNQYHVDTILLPVGAPLAGALKQSQKWRVVYDDGMAIVFRSNVPSAARTSITPEGRIPGNPGYNRIPRAVTVSRDGTRGQVQTPRTRS